MRWRQCAEIRFRRTQADVLDVSNGSGVLVRGQRKLPLAVARVAAGCLIGSTANDWLVSRCSGRTPGGR